MCEVPPSLKPNRGVGGERRHHGIRRLLPRLSQGENLEERDHAEIPPLLTTHRYVSEFSFPPTAAATATYCYTHCGGRTTAGQHVTLVWGQRDTEGNDWPFAASTVFNIDEFHTPNARTYWTVAISERLSFTVFWKIKAKIQVQSRFALVSQDKNYICFFWFTFVYICCQE